MESRNRNADEGEPPAEPEAPREGHATGGAVGPQSIGTDDPAILPGTASDPDWLRHPDQTMAIETSRIRGPSEPFHPNFVMVPVEVERPKNGRSDPKGKGKEEKGGESGDGSGSDSEDENDGKGGGKGQKGEGAKKNGPDSDENGAKDRGKSGGRSEDDKHGKSSRWPSMLRSLVVPVVVALVCGVAGAWAYSYFFGSSKSGDQSSSSKGSGSSKSSGSGGSNSGKGSDSGQGQGSGSETSKNGEDSGKIRQAESAWMMAVKDLHAAQASEKAARQSEAETKSILDFFKKTLMSAGRPVDAPLSEVFWAGGPAKDVSFRKAVDVTESQVAENFTERPLAEATVREILGLAYLTVGDPQQAVKQYERAFSLRQAMQGANAPETAACRNQLAVAYRLAGRTVEGGRLFDRNPNSPAYAATLAVSGAMLLAQKNPVDAELKLRECLTLRQKTQPNDWSTFETQSLLGEALLDQDRFADAEPLLKSGYEGMKERRQTIPTQDRSRLTKALERLIRLYESWGKEAEALRWRKDLDTTAS